MSAPGATMSMTEQAMSPEKGRSGVADERFMALALALGRRGLGQTWPNPAVGAVIVKDGIIIGRGWTQPGGRPHAEVEAIRRAGTLARGATMYVTLEPCSHVGKSPPCADAIIAAGIARVVSALEDPNPEVRGEGHARLAANGIAVDVGPGAEQARRDHAGHIRRVCDGRPHVILKLALSSDGQIALPGGRPTAITGETASRRVHLLRAQSDAILIGIGTALADDPLLTCRLPGMANRSPVRVVLDGALRLPSSGRLAKTARETPLWILTSPLAEAPAAARLGAEGAEIIRLPGGDVRLDLAAALHALAERGITRLLVEGGSRIASAFARAGLVDEAWLFQSQKPIGAGGVPALDGLPLETLTASPALKLRATEQIGDDRLSIYERV